MSAERVDLEEHVVTAGSGNENDNDSHPPDTLLE